jgi:hypothetical protein
LSGKCTRLLITVHRAATLLPRLLKTPRRLAVRYDMVSHMKTTIQIPDSLFEEVRTLAHQERTTMKVIVEEGLRKIVSERKLRSRFKLRKATFKGNGLQPHLAGKSWDQILQLSYEGRGA